MPYIVMFKTKGGGVKGVLTNVKKTAVLVKRYIPKYVVHRSVILIFAFLLYTLKLILARNDLP